jgi:formimidoylglutamate deiminase
VTILAPDLLYRDGAFHAGMALEYDARSGSITRIAARAELGDGDVVALPGRALMPGLVNAHSHAFQRLIRGRTQWRPGDESVSDFWTWREAMYEAALTLSPDAIYDVSRFCFLEMLRAGITTVGEFHYLHNDEAGRPYGDPAELARRVIEAACDVGIRIRLLNTCYATGAVGAPLRPEQRRFGTPDLDAFVRMTETLREDAAGNALVSVGVAPHSVRAVPREWIRELHTWAGAQDVPCHMHVSEQPAEVAASIAAYGMRPVEMLDADGVLDARFTAVHATHIDDGEVDLLARSGATVCACPGTERDLGDGFLRARDLIGAGGSIALGSDSQTIIDHFEEARLAEYSERLRRTERVILTRGAERREVAPVLFDMMTISGARALQLECGVLEAGRLADFIGIDLAHHTLAGWTEGTLSAMVALSAPADVVSDVWVGGRHVVAGRMHPRQDEAMQAFNKVARS